MEWMAWTLPTAIFFIVIGLMLIGMTIWQTVSPGVQRQGFLPISTTRGDRLFISLLIAGYGHLLLLGFTEWPLWIATLASVGAFLIIMKWG